MATTNALITCPNDVAFWDISLAELRVFGQTAAAAVAWACHGLSPTEVAVLTDVWEFGDELATPQAGWPSPPLADIRSVFAEMQNFLAGQSGAPTGFTVTGLGSSPIGWTVDFSPGERRGALPDQGLLRWSVRLGRFCGQQFLEYLITQVIGDRPLTVRVHPGRDGGRPMNHPWCVRVAHGRVQVRRHLQGFDAAEPDPIVLVDNDWDGDALADSVVAQLIEWHYRAAKDGHDLGANAPAPADDALAWWTHWATRIARHDVDFAELVTIAERSVRPATAAGHHTYWRESLKLRPRGGCLYAACGTLGISRSTAYRRLELAGRRAREFTSINELVVVLRDHASKRRPRLTADQHELVEALVLNGMNYESARKLERRTRPLPKEERIKRLSKKLNAARESLRHRQDRA